jgi:hypothetical protein
VLAALGTTAVWRWRLRVDSSGIARRRVLRWDLWPWECFEQGNVLDAEGAPTTYILPDKPFGARKLTLDLLEDADRARLAAIIDGLRVRPALDLPGELAVRYGFRKQAVFAPGGLLLRHGQEEMRYGWKDVLSLRIHRSDRLRRDFKSLEIVLPDRIVPFWVHLHNGQLTRSWSAINGGETPTSEMLAAVLERSIRSERVQVTSFAGAPLNEAEWHDRRSILTRQLREVAIIRRILWFAALLMFAHALSGFSRGLVAVLGMTIIYSVPLSVFFLVLRYSERDHQGQLARLEAQIPEE